MAHEPPPESPTNAGASEVRDRLTEKAESAFRRLTRRLLTVSPAELKERERKWRDDRDERRS